MQNAEKNDSANVELMEKHMSPELIAKLMDYTAQYDADAVIHAQDVSNYSLESLIVIPIEGTDDGYMVKYKWAPDSNYVIIVLRANITNDKLNILDISSIGTSVDGKSYIKRN